MSTVGEITITGIQREYNLGFYYAKNIIEHLVEIGYIKQKNETIYCHGISGGFIGNDASYGSGTTRTSNESAGYCEWF